MAVTEEEVDEMQRTIARLNAEVNEARRLVEAAWSAENTASRAREAAEAKMSRKREELRRCLGIET